MFKGKDDFELWVMKDDGTDKKKLAGDFEAVSAFAWSPGGRKIAFVGYKSGNSEIYIINADGSEQRNLTNNPAYDGSPAWSPFLPLENKDRIKQ
jgi:TolB protein